ncbi:gigantea, partial [Trifolium medium]|nr:gigantea [Trifolium medium]
LLEATARAIQPVLEFGEPGLAVADGLSNLLKVNKLPLLKTINLAEIW